MTDCARIVVREECCAGEVLDTRLAFLRRTLEIGNGDSGDLFGSLFQKRLAGYNKLRDSEMRDYLDSILA
jgi:hypothetical protein